MHSHLTGLGKYGLWFSRQRFCVVVRNKFLIYQYCDSLTTASTEPVWFSAVAPSDPPRPGSCGQFYNSCKYSGLLCLSLEWAEAT